MFNFQLIKLYRKGVSDIKLAKKDCPCKRINCQRHGKCEECREHHKFKEKRFPAACERFDGSKAINGKTK